MPRETGQPDRRKEPIRYGIRIADWAWDYHLTITPASLDPNHILEGRTIELWGDLVFPVVPKVTSARVRLSPFLDMASVATRLKPVESLGSISTTSGTFEASSYLATDLLHPVLTTLAARQTRYIVVYGTPLRYRQANLLGYGLSAGLSEEDRKATADLRQTRPP